MAVETMSQLERIAEEVNKPDSIRDPSIILDAITQYSISLGKTPFSHLDEFTARKINPGFAKALGVQEGRPRQMQQRLVELGVFSPNLADPEYTPDVRDDVIDNIKLWNRKN